MTAVLLELETERKKRQRAENLCRGLKAAFKSKKLLHANAVPGTPAALPGLAVLPGQSTPAAAPAYWAYPAVRPGYSGDSGPGKH